MKQPKSLFIILGLVLVIVIGGVAFAAGNHKKSTSVMTNSSDATAKTDSMQGMDMSQGAAASDATATNAVAIENYMFGPKAIKVKVGDTVTWTNNDSVHHNVVADTASSSAPDGPLIGKGETYSFKFTKAGTYTYHCMPHTYMHGTVIVSE